VQSFATLRFAFPKESGEPLSLADASYALYNLLQVWAGCCGSVADAK